MRVDTVADRRTDLLSGVVVASVTPTTPTYEVDVDRLREQLDFVVEGGVQRGTGVLMAAGGGGEGYFLSDEQWRTVVEVLADVAGDRVPTMVGVFDLNARHAAEKIRFAERLGIDFVQLAPPHYEKPTDPEVYEYYRLASEAATDAGILVYHTYWAVPEYYEITLPLMCRLADLENVVGVKWASARADNYVETVAELGDELVFVDNQGWVQTLQENHGMDAFMFFVGNYDPGTAVEVAEQFLAGEYADYAETKAEAEAVRAAVREAIHREVHGTGTGELRSLGEGTLGKATMDVVGRPMGPPFPPQHRLSEAAKEEIREEFGLD